VEEKLQTVLQFIRGYLATEGYPPTYHEIADGCGFKSTSNVSYYLKKLEQAGRITRKRNSARSLRLVR
jgi:repressor LexA